MKKNPDYLKYMKNRDEERAKNEEYFKSMPTHKKEKKK